MKILVIDGSGSFGAAILVVIVGLSIAVSGPVTAQSVPPGAQDPGGGGLAGTLSHSELERLSGDRTDHEKNALAQAKARSQSSELAAALNLACEVREAERVGMRRVTANGKEIEADVFEVACGNGAGYFLMSQGSEKPVGISCLAAAAARVADEAAGRKPDMVCKLPENRDVKQIAASLMSNAGTPCAVRDLHWVGKSAAVQSEFNTVVCGDGQGYLLQTAMPGSDMQTRVMTCVDAARQGLKCRLSKTDAVDP
jgi:hypothetical protein